MQKAASNTCKTITVSHSAIRHFLARLHSLVTAVAHTGTDIACAEGTPILAAADGTVTVANSLDSWGGSYGHCIQIDHGGGLETLYSRYADKLYRRLCSLLYAGGHA
mgnify:CR=1 FL=1